MKGKERRERLERGREIREESRKHRLKGKEKESKGLKCTYYAWH